MKKPCDECPTQKMYALTFDMHISGEDCPYECEEYEHWKQFQKELNHEGEHIKPATQSATDYDGVNVE